MGLYGAFSSSVLGMNSQAHALNTIGVNIANVNTGGFKETDTRFSTLLAKSYFEQSDIGGVKPKDFNRIAAAGTMASSASELDVAINGQGFFILNEQQDGGGETLYSRDGSLAMRTGADISVLADDGSTITSKEGYLVDKNGYFVQGWSANANGGFSTTGSLSSLRVDQFAFVGSSLATTTGTLSLNLPADDPVAASFVYDTDVIDSAGARKTVRINFAKSATVNNWDVSYTTDTGTSATTAFTFSPNGALTSASPYSMALTWVGGSSATVALDVSNMTQYAGDFTKLGYSRNGYASADMVSFAFDQEGVVVGAFEDGSHRDVYKLALAQFSNPNALDVRNGMTFTASSESGTATVVAAGTGYATFSPNTHELSNVDLADQFTKMIMTQTAYNASSTVFRTVDEMTTVARDLKR
jgi:flagellar hook protein FlgE